MLLLNLAPWHNVINNFPTCISEVLTLKYSRTKQTKHHNRASGSPANDLNRFLLDLSHLVRALLKANFPFVKKVALTFGHSLGSSPNSSPSSSPDSVFRYTNSEHAIFKNCSVVYSLLTFGR